MKKQKIGPINYYWGPKKAFLNAYLGPNDNYGWEWGADPDESRPILALRLFGLDVVHFERFTKGGFDLRIMGLWWIK